jgi:hypothetical protein
MRYLLALPFNFLHQTPVVCTLSTDSSSTQHILHPAYPPPYTCVCTDSSFPVRNSRGDYGSCSLSKKSDNVTYISPMVLIYWPLCFNRLGYLSHLQINTSCTPGLLARLCCLSSSNEPKGTLATGVWGSMHPIRMSIITQHQITPRDNKRRLDHQI